MLPIQNTWSKESVSKLKSFLIIALMFSIPISSSGKSIFLVLILLTMLISEDTWTKLRALCSQNWCKATIFLFTIALLACLWSPATLKEQWMILGKYTKLLYLPILVVACQDKTTRQYALYAFLAAMFITDSLSLLSYTGAINAVLDAHFISYDSIFRNHIMTSFMTSIAAYIACLFFFRTKGLIRWVFALLFLLFSYHILFINLGRMGYILYLVLMCLLMMQLFTAKRAFTAVMAVCAIAFVCYSFSFPMQVGMQRIVTEWQHYQNDDNPNTSLGYRIQFHNYAKQLFSEHPLIGHGTGSFTYSFRVFKPVPSWQERLLEPHSQYWLIASEFGVLGLFGLFLFLCSLFVAALKLNEMRPIALGILLALTVGNLSDSLLLYSGTGYLFIVLMALCLGEEKTNVLN